jgi:mono/diheme cytochrome c family protein
MKTFLLLVFLAVGLEAETDAVTARLYRLKCAGCHGPDGAGGVGASLKGKLHHSHAQLFNVIKNGVPGSEMPASGLPDPQIKKMVDYVLDLNKKKP